MHAMHVHAHVHDDDLKEFEASGAPPLPPGDRQGHVEHDGARIWYSLHGAETETEAETEAEADAGAGADVDTVILLHGGLGHSSNWGYQIPALVDAGYRVIAIDTRGHGRSTRDARPFSYELFASDVLAVMDTLDIAKATLVGWSDGACTSLVLALRTPSRVSGVFYFACNMDPSGVHPFEMTPVIQRCFNRHKADYAALSATPGEFDAFADALTAMQGTQPNFSAADLAAIRVPVRVVHSEHEEFIKREHAEYLARTIPGAELVLLNGVSHFAPLQRPARFNAALLAFLESAKG